GYPDHKDYEAVVLDGVDTRPVMRAGSAYRWLIDAPGDGPHPAGGGEPDGQGRESAAADGDPEGQRVAAGGVVEQARHPGPRRPAPDRGQHQGAEDGAVVAARENLDRDGPDD